HRARSTRSSTSPDDRRRGSRSALMSAVARTPLGTMSSHPGRHLAMRIHFGETAYRPTAAEREELVAALDHAHVDPASPREWSYVRRELKSVGDDSPLSPRRRRP